MIVNVEGAIRKQGRWIIVERSAAEEHAGGLLSLVGGKVEADDAPHILERTLQREITEEIGITIEPSMTYVHSTAFTTAQGVHVVNVIFLCTYAHGTLAIQAPDEVAAIHLLTTAELLASAAPPYVKDYIVRANALLGGDVQ